MGIETATGADEPQHPSSAGHLVDPAHSPDAQPPASDAQPQVPGALGANYRLLECIGRGAAGEVWRAADQRTGEQVAAKLLRPELVDDHAVVAGFLAERGLLVSLRHPAIVAVRDLVAEDGRLAIVMDLVDGGSLRDQVEQRGTLAPELATGVLAQVLDALAHARVAGVQHRDVKPDNVLLAADWERLEPGDVKLADFGVARLAEGGRRVSTGLLGTPEYMAPELIETGRSGYPGDVYGAAIVGYELLAGRTPFAGPGNDFSVAHRQVGAEPPPLPVPDELWQLLAAMLAKDPAARPTAAQAAARLRALQPLLAGLPALPRQSVDDFERTERPATMLWGQQAAARPEPPRVEASEAPELGAAPGETILRPQAPIGAWVAPQVELPPAPVPWWRRPVVWIVLAALLLAGGGLTALLLTHPQWLRTSQPSSSASAEVRPATQQSQELPTGLGVSRSATYDAAAHLVDLTFTYTAQKAALHAPVLEVVPGSGQDCPAVDWSGKPQQRNLPTVTGISVDCGWSLDVSLPAQGSETFTARVPVQLSDGGQALQKWLDDQAKATSDAVGDDQVSGDAYPLQRLQGLQVQVPPRVVAGSTVPVTVVPVWPAGADAANPIFRSPAVGGATDTLRAVAGDVSSVRFADGCSGAVKVSGDGQVVTALTVSPHCTLDAKIGNFTDLTSSVFAVATRGR